MFPTFSYEPPDEEGFCLWRPATGGFIDIYGPVRVRTEGPATARCRVETGPARANIIGAIHGGFILAYVDQAVFCGPFLLGRLSRGGAVTLSANVTFIAPGTIDRPLDAVVEIVGESGRMMFLRGLMEQDGRTVASFEATLRKLSEAPGGVANLG